MLIFFGSKVYLMFLLRVLWLNTIVSLSPIERIWILDLNLSSTIYFKKEKVKKNLSVLQMIQNSVINFKFYSKGHRLLMSHEFYIVILQRNSVKWQRIRSTLQLPWLNIFFLDKKHCSGLKVDIKLHMWKLCLFRHKTFFGEYVPHF